MGVADLHNACRGWLTARERQQFGERSATNVSHVFFCVGNKCCVVLWCRRQILATFFSQCEQPIMHLQYNRTRSAIRRTKRRWQTLTDDSEHHLCDRDVTVIVHGPQPRWRRQRRQASNRRQKQHVQLPPSPLPRRIDRQQLQTQLDAIQ